MKKILLVLSGLIFSMIASSQPNFYISRRSQIEASYTYYGNEFNNVNSAEFYIKPFIEKYGVDMYHRCINALGDGSIANEMQTLKNKGLNELAYGMHGIKYVDSIKTCFVEQGKFYILTYEPVENPNLSNITRKVYLYRRDDDGFRIASDLVCEDIIIDRKYARETELNAGKIESIYKITDATNAILKETPAIVYVVQTKEWYPGDNYVYGNMVILLIPDGKLGYRSACFESDERFAVNQIESTSTNGKLTLKYESGTIVFEIIGNDIVVGGTIKLNRQ